MHYVYIIQSAKTGELYKGSSDNLRTRIEEHNRGEVRSTKHKQPWRLIYYEAFISKKDARREELFLKSGKGRDRIKWLFSE